MVTHRSARPTRLTWDNYFVGVVGLVLGLCLGTCAALIAAPGREVAAIALGVLAVLCLLPALLRAVVELSVWVRLAIVLIGLALLLPAILVSPYVRDWAAERWQQMWK